MVSKMSLEGFKTFLGQTQGWSLKIKDPEILEYIRSGDIIYWGEILKHKLYLWLMTSKTKGILFWIANVNLAVMVFSLPSKRVPSDNLCSSWIRIFRKAFKLSPIPSKASEERDERHSGMKFSHFKDYDNEKHLW